MQIEDKPFTIGDYVSKMNVNVGKQTKKQSILIATPMYGGMCAGHYTIATINTINNLRERKVEAFLANLMNESLITRARNELVRMFLENTDCSHLMFIDADMYFEADAVGRLLDADRDVVCALYPKKEISWDRVRQAVQMNKKDLSYYASEFVLNLPHGKTKIELDEKGLLEIRHAGTGFMMIKREVFKKLKEHVPEYRSSTLQDPTGKYIKPIVRQYFDTSIDSTGALLSEDYHFCELWAKHGGKIFVDPSIHLKHIGTHSFEGDLTTIRSEHE
jgi:hypothetical protein|tara:strand:- start:2340 stop:3164 length:825 start_codon:yes stop_codon:yes gene_type:complete